MFNYYFNCCCLCNSNWNFSRFIIKKKKNPKEQNEDLNQEFESDSETIIEEQPESETIIYEQPESENFPENETLYFNSYKIST